MLWSRVRWLVYFCSFGWINNYYQIINSCSDDNQCKDITVNCHDANPIGWELICDGNDSCEGAVINVKASEDIYIQCNGEASCNGNAVIDCGTSNCYVSCAGKDACQGAKIDGSDAFLLVVNCISFRTDQVGVCNSAKIKCPNNTNAACEVNCSGIGSVCGHLNVDDPQNICSSHTGSCWTKAKITNYLNCVPVLIHMNSLCVRVVC